MATVPVAPAIETHVRSARWYEHPDARFGQWVAAATLCFLIFVQVAFPTPAPVLVSGALFGVLNALVAMSLVLVYRANRIVNFAAGDLGALPALLAVLLVTGSSWPLGVAMTIGLLAALLLGGIIEFFVIRRFRKAPRLILSVATIGLASVLAGFQLLMPRAFGFDTAPQDFPLPFRFRFEWAPVVFSSGHLLVVIVVPAIALGLALFFRYTRIGIAVRAAAESSDRASLLGVPVKRVGTLVWVMAAGLSATGVLLRAPIAGVAIGNVLGPGILLRGLAAAVLARMEKLWLAFAVAVGLGVAEQAVFWETGRTLLADAVLFFVILGALLLQRQRIGSRADEIGASTWSAAREVRPIPRELWALPLVRNTVRGAGVVALSLLVFVPLSWNGSRVNLFGVGLILAMIAVSLVILIGWAGQISLGQMAFVAFGSGVAGSLAQNGWNFFVTILAAGFAGTFVAVCIGIPALRIRGLFLAVATLALALATGSYFLNPEFFPWLVPDGRVRRPTLFGKFDLESEHTFYYVLLIMLVVVLGSASSLRRSGTGRVLVATRDNVRAAQSYGVSPVRARLSAFAISGFIAGIAGAAFVYHQHALPVSALRVDKSILVFTMVVIGGLGSIPGALIGAAYQTFLDFSPLTRLPATRLLASGFGTLAILLFLPGGLGGLAYDLRDRALRWVAVRRGIVVPSLVADVRTDEGGETLRAAARETTDRDGREDADAGRYELEEVRR